MPQMAPISWLILFIMFSFTFVIFNIVNYYNYSINNNKSESLNTPSNLNKTLFLNWKW